MTTSGPQAVLYFNRRAQLETKETQLRAAGGTAQDRCRITCFARSPSDMAELQAGPKQLLSSFLRH